MDLILRSVAFYCNLCNQQVASKISYITELHLPSVFVGIDINDVCFFFFFSTFPVFLFLQLWVVMSVAVWEIRVFYPLLSSKNLLHCISTTCKRKGAIFWIQEIRTFALQSTDFWCSIYASSKDYLDTVLDIFYSWLWILS